MSEADEPGGDASDPRFFHTDNAGCRLLLTHLATSASRHRDGAAPHTSYPPLASNHTNLKLNCKTRDCFLND